MKTGNLYVSTVLLVVLFFCSSCRPQSGGTAGAPAISPESEARLSLGGKIRNSGRMIAQIREGLRGHNSSITVSFSYGSDLFAEVNEVIEAWMEEALAETGRPDEGDYLRYQLGGYTYTSTSDLKDGRRYYTVRIVPSYYTFLSQEKEVTKEVRRIRRSLRFLPWTSRETKIRKLYEYLCANVRYDKVHRKNPYYHKRSTAYGALLRKTATCQGYCTALYRLLREERIPCRIVTGTAGDEELHAWLITEIDGLWYLLDPTWDAGQDTFRYYLRGTKDFAAQPDDSDSAEDALVPHLPGSAFQTEEFVQEHPMAEMSGSVPAKQ